MKKVIFCLVCLSVVFTGCTSSKEVIAMYNNNTQLEMRRMELDVQKLEITTKHTEEMTKLQLGVPTN